VRIESSELFMNSEHTYMEKKLKEEQLHYWDKFVNIQSDTKEIKLTISEQAQRMFEQTASQVAEKTAPALGTNAVDLTTSGEIEFELSDEDKQKVHLLQTFIESLTGKKFKFVLPHINKTEAKNIKLDSNQRQPQPQLQGWGLTYDRHESYSEYEHTSFETQGIIRTADGREIQLNLSMSMTRSFTSETNLSIRAGDALKDPLVLNFGNKPVALTATKYAFDIDSDGQDDQISFVGNQSGFLALDLNEDSIINNGSELFGAISGDGFGDLSKYDADGNNWIDENDAIFNKLRIWMKDEHGADQLIALGQQGVGAIYLGHTNTPFALKDKDNELLGRVRNSGIYLRENGAVGTVQQIDLAI
jgi:hypothetical protein